MVEPTPITDAELSTIRSAIERTDLIEEDTLPLAFTDRKRLLAEVDRLRAENTELRRNVAFAAALVSGDAAEMLPETIAQLRADRDKLARQVELYHASAESHTAKFERKHEQLREVQRERDELRSRLDAMTPAELDTVTDAAKPRHYREAARSLRALGHTAAADLLDSTARDLEDTDAE